MFLYYEHALCNIYIFNSKALAYADSVIAFNFLFCIFLVMYSSCFLDSFSALKATHLELLISEAIFLISSASTS